VPLQSAEANGGKGFSSRSIDTYSAMWGKFVKFCPNRPASATSSQLQAFLATLEGRVRSARVAEGVTPDPVAIRRRYLSMFDKLHASLVSSGLRMRNDAAPLLFALDLAQRSLARPIPIALTDQEDRTLRETIENWPCGHWRDVRDRALLALLIGSGLKVAEARDLAIDSLHLDRAPAEVTVRGGHQERMVPLTEASVQALQPWLAMRGNDVQLAPFLFPGEDQSMLSASTIYRVVATAIAKAELNPLHTGPSVLRHTFALRQLREGVPLAALSAWLGHQQETSTAVYRFMVASPGGVLVRG
jgi:integrase/recombinase XerD